MTQTLARPSRTVGQHLRDWRTRRRLSQLHFALDAGNRAQVADICRRLDGLPLRFGQLHQVLIAGRRPAEREHEGFGRHALDRLDEKQSQWRDLAAVLERTRKPGQRSFVYGVSYGTYWAQRYLHVAPTQAAGVILDSIVPMNAKEKAAAEEDTGEAEILDKVRQLAATYGNVAKPTVGAIQRQLLVLENQGAAKFFGEPALELADLMLTDSSGFGRISILAADKLMNSPRLYATFLLWLLSELFESLPEVGDPEKPKLVFFFDEAHLLFKDAPRELVSRVEQVARLIRSKGVGVYFITQNPADVPDDILGQLGNRVQHALRAFTAKDQKDLAKAAETYRPNPAFKIDEAIRDVGTGEAVTSFLEAKGIPGVAERTLIRPPSSQLGPLEPSVRAEVVRNSPVAGKYDKVIDRDSAWERLRARTGAAGGGAKDAASAPEGEREFGHGKRWSGDRDEGEPKAEKPRASRSDSISCRSTGT